MSALLRGPSPLVAGRGLGASLLFGLVAGYGVGLVLRELLIRWVGMVLVSDVERVRAL